MTIDDQIKNEKIQNDINGEAANISALPLGRINKCEYLTDEEILPPNEKQIIEQLNLFIHCIERLLKNKQKQFKIKEINQLVI